MSRIRTEIVTSRCRRAWILATSIGLILTQASELHGAAANGPPAARLSAGFGYTLAIRSDGSVVSWGLGMEGGEAVSIDGTPVSIVDGVVRAKSVSANTDFSPDRNHSLVLESDGTVKGWGRNGKFGALGMEAQRGNEITRKPVVLQGLGPAIQIQGCGAVVSVALRADGSVWITPGARISLNRSLQARRVEDLRDIAWMGTSSLPTSLMSSWSICDIPLVSRGGSARILSIWEEDRTDSNLIRTEISPPISNLRDTKQLSCRHYSNTTSRWCLALSADGTVRSWGYNSSGQLGDGSEEGRIVPGIVSGLPKVISIATSNDASLVLTEGGSVFTWGNVGGSILGRENSGREDRSRPSSIPGLDSVIEITASYKHACALKAEGSVWCWGDNRNGELGDGTLTDRNKPVRVVGVMLR